MASDIEKIVDNIKKRNKAEKAEIQQYVDRAMQEVDRLKHEFLSVDPHLRRMVLFGSLARRTASTLDSDIDLAVDSNQYLRLVSKALDSSFKVDLVDFLNIDADFLAIIERDGRTVYENLN